MSSDYIPFDRVFALAAEVFSPGIELPAGVGDLHLVRNVYGRVYVAVSDEREPSAEARATLERRAGALAGRLGPHGNVSETPVLYVSRSLIDSLRGSLRPLRPGVFFAERLVTAADWSTALPLKEPSRSERWTLYSVKGGVGRSTTAVALSEHLARQGVSVLVVDLDLESPGLAPALVGEGVCPEYGVADWFVEDLVGQGDFVLERMVGSPRWAGNYDGRALFAPAHGADPGDYLAKVGRAWMTRKGIWSDRLQRLVSELERRYEPEVTLVDSRSGMHDFAAPAVTDLGARVLMFATDSASHWNGYRILFRRWKDYGLVPALRDRVQVVSALVPELGKDTYSKGFHERSWDLFRDSFYDDLDGDTAGADRFPFGIDGAAAAHAPLPIHWNRDMAAGSFLDRLDPEAARLAYSDFFTGFDRMTGAASMPSADGPLPPEPPDRRRSADRDGCG